jgi:hypothetical protein
MRKIQAVVLFVAMLILPALANSASAARSSAQAPEPEPLTKEKVADDFQQYLLQNHIFLSDATQTSTLQEIQQYLDVLKGRDAQSKASYVEEKQLEQFLDDCQEKLNEYDEEKLDDIVSDFLKIYGDRLDNQAYHDYMQQLNELLGSKTRTLGNKLKSLEEEMAVDEHENSLQNLPWGLIGAIVCGLLVLLIIIVIVSKSKGKKNNGYKPGPATQRTPKPGYRAPNGTGQQVSSDGNIVVRRKTATILKKQSLEDVIDNPNYLKVDAVDFTYESAVRRMYIKNQCIIDIYNMYAEDLRNPQSPKEDGCMVLGRWVHDPESNEYYVSLEQIIMPGDDAVFEEYALNFGGKIKLKVLEELRRLRRETNLQYDLTCWVHSHPGLGVFFSNMDTSVQDQLKHAQHPLFLTAIVVDILTPMQDLGIFTYRRDQNINSKNDLKKMYSLIEWYQWAQESLKNAVQRPVGAAQKELSADEYFNTLEKAEERDNSCHDVQISKNVIVDICMDLATEGDDVLAMLHGFATQHGQKTEYVAEKISNNDSEPNLSLTGCFVSAPHCSIPTVRRAVQEYLDRIHFVLVYTPSDSLLTTIPVVNGDLVVESTFYGEQRMEILKTWIKQGRQ